MREVCVQQQESAVPPPPVARREARVVSIHGDALPDDYFWLREKSNPEVAACLEAENAYAAAVLRPTEPMRQQLYEEMLSRIKQTDLSVPYLQDGYFYYSRTEEGKQYPIYCRKHGSLDAAEEVTLDVNELARGEKFMALGVYTVSDDGRYLAYSTDNSGFRQYTLRIKDLSSGELLPFAAEKTVSVAWAADSRTLFYTIEDAAKRPYRVMRCALGGTQAELVREEPDERFRLSVSRSLSREFLFLSAASHTASEVRFLRAGQPHGEWSLIAARAPEHEYDAVHHGDSFYIRTNSGGRNFRLVRAPVSAPGPGNWVEVVPHRPEVMLEGMEFFEGHSVLYEREQGLPQFRITELGSGETWRIAFPEPAYTASAAANREFRAAAFRYAYNSLITPSSVFDYDFASRQSKLLKQTEVLGGYDPSRYQSRRIHATAADGTRIPISLVARKDTPQDGTAPMLLTGYGAYGHSYPPSFSSNRISLLDRGMVFAIAHIRGGGELGKPWHDQGRMLNKRNTFTDFIACADSLVAQKYAARDGLVIQGGSAGGLLMGAAVNMRPDLCKAVVSLVPFVDVLNSMLDESLPLTVGEFEEWGNPKVKEHYHYIRSYCPYTNLQRGAYPAMLIRTSFNDSQVMYWEPAKYVARLRTLKTDSNPLLLHTNMAAGHGGASGRYDALREAAFDYAFILTQTGLA